MVIFESVPLFGGRFSSFWGAVFLRGSWLLSIRPAAAVDPWIDFGLLGVSVLGIYSECVSGVIQWVERQERERGEKGMKGKEKVAKASKQVDWLASWLMSYFDRSIHRSN